jgi:hypothetical protein
VLAHVVQLLQHMPVIEAVDSSAGARATRAEAMMIARGRSRQKGRREETLAKMDHGSEE